MPETTSQSTHPTVNASFATREEAFLETVKGVLGEGGPGCRRC